MDYSAINAEDNPDASPWATSPQRNSHATFSPQLGGSDGPPSPTVPMSRASLDSTGGFADQPSQAQPRLSQADTVVENGHADALQQDPLGSATSETAPQHAQEHSQQRPQTPPQQVSQQLSPSQPPRTQQRSAQRYHGQRPRSRQEQLVYKLQPRVTGIERPSRKDLVLRFDVYVWAPQAAPPAKKFADIVHQTNLPNYRTTQFRDVRRTYVEFTRLAEHLISANPEVLVPALPPSSTPAGVGTDEDETRVRGNMHKWLSVVCGNEVLMRDEEIMRFIEGDPGYSPVIRRSQPATGVRRKVLKQFAPPPDDTPELQEARPIVKRFYLSTMDASQKVEKMVRTRRSLGLAESDFGAKLGQLADNEGHGGLKLGYRKLGRTVQAVGDLHAAQGTAEATVFGDPLQYHSANAFIVKETLTNRHLLLRDLDQAQQATRAKLSATDRLKASSSVRRDKVDEAIAALDEARGQESYLQNKTARVTANLVHERRAWFARTAEEMRGSTRELVVRQIESERRVLATLETVRADVRAIDASGGLSRLGREATPAARRANVQSSQGPKGDAWSGVQRRTDGLNRSVSSAGGTTAASSSGGGGNNSGGGTSGGGGGGEGEEGEGASSTSQTKASSGTTGEGEGQDDDQDRVDARNAASRLASSTF